MRGDRAETGRSDGEKSGNREIQSQAEIQLAQDQPVQGLRAAEGLLEKVQALPNLLSLTGQQRNAPWRHEIELVGS
jgi:hypothetical protein